MHCLLHYYSKRLLHSVDPTLKRKSVSGKSLKIYLLFTNAWYPAGNPMNLTKIFKIIRKFFNLSKIEGGDAFFSLYGRSFQLPKGRKIKNLQAEGPKIAP